MIKYCDWLNQEDLSYLKIINNDFIREFNCKIEFENNFNELRLKIQSNKIVFESVKRGLDDILKRKIVEYFEAERYVIDFFY